MALEVTPEHLSVISGQLGITQADVLQTIAEAAPLAVPFAPGADIVSALLPPAAFEHAGTFFPAALHGIGCGAEASAVLPVIGADYLIADLLGGGSVFGQSTFVE
ncbi:hypothetical protein [Nocardia jiangxiensis]|uniref:Uncharacterized protein n=1 Tax=Nocardia jiangxiensis TaxID=282685 RepID=A0ABW6S0T5_9NOCA|nr:hypothetical protein [Nocardia jiangxiensis]